MGIIRVNAYRTGSGRSVRAYTRGGFKHANSSLKRSYAVERAANTSGILKHGVKAAEFPRQSVMARRMARLRLLNTKQMINGTFR